jgi:hypothetical protein
MSRIGRLACTVAALALIGTAAGAAYGATRPQTRGLTPASSFPVVSPTALEGWWTTGTISRSDLLDHAVKEGAKRSCAADFLGAIGVAGSLEWRLDLRDGQWIIFAVVDSNVAGDFDGGTYLRFLNGDWARFTSLNPDVTDDSWLHPMLKGDHLSMDFISLTQWRPEADSTCFVTAASIVELTNPFTRVG